MPSGKGVGQRLKLRPWQRRIIQGIYGPETKDGQRLCLEAIISMARKNGKTLLVAGLVLVHLIGPEAEENGEVYSAAADEEQAAVVFKYASQMIEKTPELVDLVLAGQLKVIASRKRLAFLPLGTFYQALSKAPETKHGFNPSVMICDELAQWKRAELYDVLTSGFGAREEPLTLVISTQAANDQHLLSQLIDYAMQCERGEINNPRVRCFLYTAPEKNKDGSKLDPFSRKAQRLANPALGDFLRAADIDAAARKASGMPSREALYRNLRLNQRIAAEHVLILPADWDACAGVAEPGQRRGRSWGGLDLGATQDLTSAVFLTELLDAITGELQALEVRVRFWLPEDGLRERAERDRVPYDEWAAAGHISLTPGRTVNRDHVARDLYAMTADLDLQGIAYDRWRIEELKQRLADHGTGLPLVDWGQGFKDMAPSIDAFEAAIMEALLRHGGHPVLRMCVANAVVVKDAAGNRKLDKDKARGRIDGAVALAMACGLRVRPSDDDGTVKVIRMAKDVEVSV